MDSHTCRRVSKSEDSLLATKRAYRRVFEDAAFQKLQCSLHLWAPVSLGRDARAVRLPEKDSHELWFCCRWENQRIARCCWWRRIIMRATDDEYWWVLSDAVEGVWREWSWTATFLALSRNSVRNAQFLTFKHLSIQVIFELGRPSSTHTRRWWSASRCSAFRVWKSHSWLPEGFQLHTHEGVEGFTSSPLWWNWHKQMVIICNWWRR